MVGCRDVRGDITACVVFKQKTAYEMRISDWSSDVCSSDLLGLRAEAGLDWIVAARLHGGGDAVAVDRRDLVQEGAPGERVATLGIGAGELREEAVVAGDVAGPVELHHAAGRVPHRCGDRRVRGGRCRRRGSVVHTYELTQLM